MEHLQHFARTLRPRKLSDVIGQDFVVSMLQNSIYLGRFFPVYLFHGQRGCGKTTVARIVAAMINCSNLDAFKQNPRGTTLPCLECPSCVATAEGNHPDFIEIDAASHTGVDHVRTILESAHYLPLMGRKKIYLIDEAHMLSKAAFNALLKMLEEPPAQALFILATTEVVKIPVTVRSRAFQGIFNAPDHAIVTAYLKTVATRHNLTLSDEAAHLIVTKAERCIRDALNLLEQLGAISPEISAETVTKALGIADKTSLLKVMEAVIAGDQERLFAALTTTQHEKNPTTFWHTLSESFQSLVRLHFKAPGLGIFATHEAELKALAASTNSQQLAYFNTQFWNAERVFNITSTKSLFIEHFLSSLCTPAVTLPMENQTEAASQRRAMVDKPAPQKQPAQQQAAPQPRNMARPTEETPAHQPSQAPSPRTPAPFQSSTQTSEHPASWNAFLAELSTNADKIPFGVFKQASPTLNGTTLVVEIPNFNSFLEEQLSGKADIWKACLKRHMSQATTFTIKAAPAAPSPLKKTASETPQQPAFSSRALAEGPTTDLIMRYFPGKLV